MVTGRLFHNDGPATEKARRPYRSRLYRGIVKERWAADLSERVGAYGVTSDTNYDSDVW